MKKYYTKACNFYYGNKSIEMLNKKKALSLNGNKLISFDSVQIITRDSSKVINISQIKNLGKILKKKILIDLKQIKKKKKFSCLKFSHKPILVGILNLTPDSFSDGGKFNKSGLALKRIKYLKSKGCNLIDIGGESTRPGSKQINEKKEWERIRDVLNKVKKINIKISIDTRKTFVMKKSFNYGVNIINDISGLCFDESTVDFLKKTKLPFVLNHSKGTPEIMQNSPKYNNVLLDIYDFFESKIKFLRKKGINHKNIILDPGIGFGKNLKHNITIIKDISIFHSLGFPIMLGHSRKRFIKGISNNNDSKTRIGGTIAGAIKAMLSGVQLLRVHDYNEIEQSLKVFNSLSE